jgi:hypothetical protein
MEINVVNLEFITIVKEVCCIFALPRLRMLIYLSCSGHTTSPLQQRLTMEIARRLVLMDFCVRLRTRESGSLANGVRHSECVDNVS